MHPQSSGIISVTVTNDNNNIVSGSEDSTISMWNLLEKRQETVFCRYNSSVISLAMIKDKK